MFTDWFVMKREEHLAEEQAIFWGKVRDELNGRPLPPDPAVKPHCFICMAHVDWKCAETGTPWERRQTTYEPGTWTKHVCKPKPKLVDWGLEQWRERQRQGEGKMTLQIGGKKVKL